MVYLNVIFCHLFTNKANTTSYFISIFPPLHRTLAAILVSV